MKNPSLNKMMRDMKNKKGPRAKKDIPVSKLGHLEYPYDEVRIPSNRITMQGVPYPLKGVGSSGQEQMMYPGQEYFFPDSTYVDEYPLIKAQNGIELNLPKYNKPKDRTFSVNPYAFGFNPASGVNIFGIGVHPAINLLNTKKDKLDLTGDINSVSVGYPGGYELFGKPQYGIGIRYKHSFRNGGDISIPNLEEGGWLNRYDKGGQATLDKFYKNLFQNVNKRVGQDEDASFGKRALGAIETVVKDPLNALNFLFTKKQKLSNPWENPYGVDFISDRQGNVKKTWAPKYGAVDNSTLKIVGNEIDGSSSFPIPNIVAKNPSVPSIARPDNKYMVSYIDEEGVGREEYFPTPKLADEYMNWRIANDMFYGTSMHRRGIYQSGGSLPKFQTRGEVPWWMKRPSDISQNVKSNAQIQREIEGARRLAQQREQEARTRTTIGADTRTVGEKQRTKEFTEQVNKRRKDLGFMEGAGHSQEYIDKKRAEADRILRAIEVGTLLEAPVSAGIKGIAKTAPSVGEYLTTGPLRNAWKLNPYHLNLEKKIANENLVARQIFGDKAYESFLKHGPTTRPDIPEEEMISRFKNLERRNVVDEETGNIVYTFAPLKDVGFEFPYFAQGKLWYNDIYRDIVTGNKTGNVPKFIHLPFRRTGIQVPFTARKAKNMPEVYGTRYLPENTRERILVANPQGSDAFVPASEKSILEGVNSEEILNTAWGRRILKPGTKFSNPSEYTIYEPHWWKRYKQVSNPTSVSSSVDDVVDFSKYPSQLEAVQARAERLLSQKHKKGGQINWLNRYDKGGQLQQFNPGGLTTPPDEAAAYRSFLTNFGNSPMGKNMLLASVAKDNPFNFPIQADMLRTSRNNLINSANVNIYPFDQYKNLVGKVWGTESSTYKITTPSGGLGAFAGINDPTTGARTTAFENPAIYNSIIFNKNQKSPYRFAETLSPESRAHVTTHHEHSDENFPGLLVHELSHAGDHIGYLIPDSDKNLMLSYSNPGEGKTLSDFQKYVAKPTETRARLMDFRFNAKKQGLYDPFTQKVTKDLLKKYNNVGRGAYDPLMQLRYIYTDDEIIDLLNKVSKSEDPSGLKNDDRARTAENGLLISKNNIMRNRQNFLKQYRSAGLVDYLAAKNMRFDKQYRAKLAEEFGIEGYDFSAEKNMQLLNLLEKKYGKLPDNHVSSGYTSSKGKGNKGYKSIPIDEHGYYETNADGSFDKRKGTTANKKIENTTTMPEYNFRSTYPMPAARDNTYVAPRGMMLSKKELETAAKIQQQKIEEEKHKAAMGNRNLESGVVVDKGTNTMYVVKNNKAVKQAPVLTGQAGKNHKTDPNANPYSVSYLENNPQDRSTPTGTYIMDPRANIYGWPGYRLRGIPAFGVVAPNAANTAMHITYGAAPLPGMKGGHDDPAEFRRRNAGYSMPGNQRYMSYGCTNMQGETIDCLQNQFPKGDTAIYIDSRNPKDLPFLKHITNNQKKSGGSTYSGGVWYQDGSEVQDAINLVRAFSAPLTNYYSPFEKMNRTQQPRPRMTQDMYMMDGGDIPNYMQDPNPMYNFGGYFPQAPRFQGGGGKKQGVAVHPIYTGNQGLAVHPVYREPNNIIAEYAQPTPGNISEYLDIIGIDPSYQNRVEIAKRLGIPNYTGTAAQNIGMYNKLYNNGAISNQWPQSFVKRFQNGNIVPNPSAAVRDNTYVANRTPIQIQRPPQGGGMFIPYPSYNNYIPSLSEMKYGGRQTGGIVEGQILENVTPDMLEKLQAGGYTFEIVND